MYRRGSAMTLMISVLKLTNDKLTPPNEVSHYSATASRSSTIIILLTAIWTAPREDDRSVQDVETMELYRG
jgi:hypothetical protein